MFNGVKMRKNGEWYAFYKDIIDGCLFLVILIIQDHMKQVQQQQRNGMIYVMQMNIKW